MQMGRPVFVVAKLPANHACSSVINAFWGGHIRILGSHLVERCQLFVMVALAETIMASGLYIARAAQWTMPILLGFFIFLGLGKTLPSLVLCCVGTLLLLSVAWSVERSNRA
ncbi:low temperature requirement protein A [Acetobacter sp. DmW_136]|nr:low temperature requirement protein A [Acetobacter sp. DmW_136]